MEHIYKYRHLYGFDEGISKSVNKLEKPLYPNATSYRMDTFTDIGEYPKWSVLWTCRHLHTFVIYFGTSIRDVIAELRDEITAGGGTLPTVVSKLNSFSPSYYTNHFIRRFRHNSIRAVRIWKTGYSFCKELSKNFKKLHGILIIILTSATILLYLRTKCFVRHNPKNEICVRDKVVLITGGNSGIGEQLAHEFVQRGAYVILASSDLGRTLQTVRRIHQHMAITRGTEYYDWNQVRKPWTKHIPSTKDYVFPTPHNQARVQDYVKKTQWVHLDLGDIRTIWIAVHHIFEIFDHIDIIINNAALRLPHDYKSKTYNGFETHFGVNYLGHFVLTNMILGYMKPPFKRPCKIINVTCNEAFSDGRITLEEVHRFGMRNGDFENPYGTSKLCNFLFHVELTQRVKSTSLGQVQTYLVCPIKCETNLYRYYKKSWFDTAEDGLPAKAGIQTILHCALSPDCQGQTGQYYEDCRVSTPPLRCCYNYPNFGKICKRLWNVSQEITTNIVNEIKRHEYPLNKCTFHGDTVFNRVDRNEEEPYRPEVARELIEFRNHYYTPIYLKRGKEEWTVGMTHQGLLEFWIECHGPLRYREQKTSRAEHRKGKPLDLFSDRLPVLPETYGWMY